MARVMVVDDSPVDVERMRQMLVRAGHDVLQAASGRDALELVKSDRPDCIVMDVVMPDVNGFQATRTLHRDPATSAIPVIVVSAKSQESDRQWALRQGARDYIVKPVKETELVDKIRSLLGG